MPDQRTAYQSLLDSTRPLQHRVRQSDWAEIMRQPAERVTSGAWIGAAVAGALGVVGFVLWRASPDGTAETVGYAALLVLTFAVAALQSLFLSVAIGVGRLHMAWSAVLGLATPAVFKLCQEAFFELPDLWVWVLGPPATAALFLAWWWLVPLAVAAVSPARTR